MKNAYTPADLSSQGELVGDPTLAYQNVARRTCAAYVGRRNPHAFYCLVDPRDQPRINWSHNIGAHFTFSELSYEKFFGEIHPFWQDIYQDMGAATFALLNLQKDPQETSKLRLTAHVPLRNKGGKYYWYSQVSIPCTYDANGMMVEYLNEFHRLTEFDRLIPSRPHVTYNGKQVVEFTALLIERGGRSLTDSLRVTLSTANLRVLTAYRVALQRGGQPSRDDIATYLGIGVVAVDKANLRLLAQASPMFPRATLSRVVDFARFLNTYYGPPRE